MIKLNSQVFLIAVYDSTEQNNKNGQTEYEFYKRKVNIVTGTIFGDNIQSHWSESEIK